MKYLACVLLLFSFGCSQVFQTIKGEPKYGPDTLLSVLDQLQDSAIDANNRKELSESSTRMIVTFVVNSAKLVKASSTTTNYKVLIGAQLQQLRTDLPVVDAQKYSATFNLLDKILSQR